MAYKLPPLHLLTIFEAAARLGSFKAASEELFLTPSAVSHQIKALEDHLGFVVFQRKSRGVEVNSAGTMYLHHVQKGLLALEQGTKTVKHRFSTPSLKISCVTTLASNIIIPQIGAFQHAHPDIDLRIETGNQVADLRYDDVDLAIRVGSGEWPNLVVDKITDLKIGVVGSASFIKKHDINIPSDVNKVPLIDLSYMDDMWSQWANALSLPEMKNKRSITFNDYDSTVQAASQGVGLALGMFPIENVQLQSGVIVRPFDEDIDFPLSLYAVYRKEDDHRHDIKCFLNWLRKSQSLKPNT